ncbi:MAG: PEPxxWA-CTERM sorting domain-containing protein [Pseudomonadota bacterium]
MFKGAVFGLALAAAAGPASALVYTINIVGNVITYGPNGQEGLGPQFNAEFRVDTSKAPEDGVTWSLVSPIWSESYTPPQYLNAWASPGDAYARRLDYSWGYAGGGDASFAIARGHEIEDYLWDPIEYVNGGLDSGQYHFLELAFFFDNIPGLVGPDGIPRNRPLSSSAEILGYFGSNHGYSGGGLGFVGPNVGFNLRGNSYSVDIAVPEPTTWALMIAGFGLVGAALRRHRQQALAA